MIIIKWHDPNIYVCASPGTYANWVVDKHAHQKTQFIGPYPIYRPFLSGWLDWHD